MKLEGGHVLNAPRKLVWDLLMNPEHLVKITPGISDLIKIDDTNYDAIAEVKIGPVKGKFKGKLSLEDLEEPEKFNLHVTQNSKIGNVDAVIGILLTDVGKTQTNIEFEGNAKLSGLLARTGQRVVSGVAHSLTKQFFAAFDKEIQTMQA